LGDFSTLIDDWFRWQEALPYSDNRKRANSTIAENRREAAYLKRAFGHLNASEITTAMGYEYLDACLVAVDQKGNARPRPQKGNKEIALAQVILKFAIRKGLILSNPFDKMEKNQSASSRRLVTQKELALAVEMGRRIGGPQHIVAMALQTAFLCVRRSVEVRGLTRDCITDDGLLWKDGKDAEKPAILIQWTPELRETINETIKFKRNKVAGTMFLFGNMQGQKYTKGGWKSSLDDLMHPCVEEANKRGIPFKRFSLQDCRPMAVTDKLARGDKDTKDATGHTSDAMIHKHYDRRKTKVATGARLPKNGGGKDA
jgi:integrase